MFELQQFDGEATRLTKQQLAKVRPLLLATEKFIEVDGELINISGIKAVRKNGIVEDIDIDSIDITKKHDD